MKTKVGIGLIHNNNLERNNYILPNIKKLIEVLSEDFDVSFNEFSFQPNLEIYDLKLYKRKKFVFWLKRESEMVKFLKNFYKFSGISYPRIRGMKFFLSRIKRLLSIGLDKFLKINFIENILTDKHIRAWSCLSERNEYLIIFEDDAVFNENSFKDLKRILNFVVNSGCDLVYVDYANGLDISFVDKVLKMKEEKGIVFYKSVISNTTCSYLISSELAKLFLGIVITRPELRLIPIDWLINILGVIVSNSGINTLCIHCSPPLVSHGSLAGNYKDFRS